MKKAQRELQRKYKDNHKEKYRITKKSTESQRKARKIK